MTCCANTACRSRLAIYSGKANEDEDAVVLPAVLKKLTQVLRGQPARRLICTDNVYTSVPLSHKLLSMGHAHVGTTGKNRTGWCLGIGFTQKKRHKRMPCGTYRITLWRGHPEFVALTWMDNKPVRVPATGCSTWLTHVSRRERDGSVSQVPCRAITTKRWGGCRRTRPVTASTVLDPTIYSNAQVLQDYFCRARGHCHGKCIYRAQASDIEKEQTCTDTCSMPTATSRRPAEPN